MLDTLLKCIMAIPWFKSRPTWRIWTYQFHLHPVGSFLMATKTLSLSLFLARALPHPDCSHLSSPSFPIYLTDGRYLLRISQSLAFLSQVSEKSHPSPFQDGKAEMWLMVVIKGILEWGCPVCHLHPGQTPNRSQDKKVLGTDFRGERDPEMQSACLCRTFPSFNSAGNLYHSVCCVMKWGPCRDPRRVPAPCSVHSPWGLEWLDKIAWSLLVYPVVGQVGNGDCSIS